MCVVGKVHLYICRNMPSSVSCPWWKWQQHHWALVWRWEEWEGGRLIRNLSKALLPLMKVTEDMAFPFTTLYGVQSSRDFVSTWEDPLIHSFVFWYRRCLTFISLWDAQRLITQQGCAPRSLHSGKGSEDVCITNYDTEGHWTFIQDLITFKVLSYRYT